MNDERFWLVANTIVTTFNVIGGAFAIYLWVEAYL